MVTGQQLDIFASHRNTVTSAFFSPGETRAVTVSSDHTARIWDVQTGLEFHTLVGHEDQLSSAQMGQCIAWPIHSFHLVTPLNFPNNLPLQNTPIVEFLTM
ncbi:hypothetical protein KFU94_26365 [Chloroflexi bacterium TSY]|nr:hypothetical protein [Chloroflexi bacterium TSY]